MRGGRSLPGRGRKRQPWKRTLIRQQGGEDWNSPKVYAYYGGGEPNGGGEELLSPRLLEKLREHTRPRSNEFGVLIERRSAKVVFMGEGQRRTVEFDPVVFAQYDDIVPIHTHDDDLPFSDGD